MTDLTASSLAQQLRRNRRPSSSLAVQAATVSTALTKGMTLSGSSLTRTETINLYRRWIVTNFGQATLDALKPRKLPVGTCRWCLVRAYGKVDRTRVPRITAAARALLGPACASCRTSKINRVAQRATLVASASRQKSAYEAIIASGTVTARDKRGRPTRVTVKDECGCGCRTQLTPAQERALGVVDFTFTPKKINYRGMVTRGRR